MQDKEPENNEKSNKKKDSGLGPILSAVAVTTVIGVELAIMVTIGFYAGMAVDDKLGTDPWVMIAGILGGIAAGIWGIIKTLERFWKEGE